MDDFKKHSVVKPALGKIALIVAVVFVLLIGCSNQGDNKLIEAAQNAYSQYAANAEETLQWGIYEAEGRFVALNNGASAGIFAKRTEAVKALADKDADKYYCFATSTEGLCVLREGVAEQLVTDYEAVEALDGASLPTCKADSMPLAYTNLCMFENRYITQIRVFVGTVDAEQEYTFHVSVLEGGSVKKNGQYQIKKTGVVTVKGSELSANAWNTLDVSGLGLAIAEGETLGFGSAESTLPVKYSDSSKSDELGFFSCAYAAISEQARWNLLVGVWGVDTNPEFTAKKEELKQLLQGKYISIFGDSICTFNGVANDAMANSTIGINKQYYPAGNVTSADQTFWMQLVQEYDMNLLVNNSWSGSCVIPVKPDGAGYGSRAQQLHADTGANAGKNPDIIICNMGTNDILSDKPIGNLDDMTFAWAQQYVDGQMTTTPPTFAAGYAVMLEKVTRQYPNAEIFLINMLVSGSVPMEKSEKYNKVVNAAAEHYGCHIVDLTHCYMSGANYEAYSNDDLHPNKSGMDLWTNLVAKTMMDYYLKEN